MTLGEEYLEKRFRERAIRICMDDDGLEYLELDGRPRWAEWRAAIP